MDLVEGIFNIFLDSGWTDWGFISAGWDGLEWAGRTFIWAWTFLDVGNGEKDLKIATFAIHLS